MKFYILEAILSKDNKFVVDVLGVYSDESLAIKYKKICEKDLTKDERKFIKFDYRQVELDKDPGFTLSPVDDDVVDKAIMKMMQDGLIDQLIGEDGEFYYVLTKNGRDRGIFLPDEEE